MQIYTSKHQLWSADLVYVKLYLSQLPFVSTCQMLTTDLSGPGPWFLFCINPNVQDILHRADETCPNTKDYPDPKSFPISSYTCNESEDTQTHHIFVRAQRNSIAPRWIHLSVMQTVTSTPCWSALFSSNFPNTPSWYREKRTVTESDETALGSRASVQRSNPVRRNGSRDENRCRSEQGQLRPQSTNKARWCRDL